MAKQKLSNFKFDDEIKLKLHKMKFRTIEDLFSQSFLQLMTNLNLSAEETQNLITEVSSSCLPKMYKAGELLEKELRSSISFGDPQLDRVLQGCVKQGTLSEFTGPPGIGKTQMCLHLSLKCLERRSDRIGVCFIDTEGAFRSERLVELLEQSQMQEKIEQILSNIHIFQPKTVSSLTEIFSTLEIFCIEKSIGLVIVDSIASLARKEFSQNTKFERASALASWAAQIKALADQLQIATVVTNQVTTNVSLLHDPTEIGDNNDAIQEADRKTFFICPALGKTWTHFINTRFILQFSDNNKRQLIVAKSSNAPVVVKNYRIESNGIQFEDEMSYTLTGMDPHLYRIKTVTPL